jgi:PAS domain S-box-containing protein
VTAVFRYGISAISVFAAIGIRYALDPWIDIQVPFITFFFAVMVTTWIGGLGPGLLASALSTLAADFFFIEPVYQLNLSKGGFIPLVIFVLETTVIAIVGGKQDALRQHEARFTAIFKQSVAGMAETDLTGRFLQVNQTYCQMVGRSPLELLNLRIQDITHPDDLSGHLARFQSLLERAGPSFTIEKRYLRPDGQPVWVNQNISIVRKENGQAKSIIAIALDITERKQAEDALRESEGRFRRMADTAPVLMWLSDTNKLCTWFNKPWLEFRGRTLEQELGNGWADGVHQDDVGRCLTTYITSFNNQQPFTMEYRLCRQDGQYRWMLDTGIPCFSEAGSFTGYIGSCVDISDLKNVEEALQESNERLEALSIHLEQLVEVRTAALLQSEVRLRALATDLNLAEQRERKHLADQLHDHLSQLLALGRIKVGQAKRIPKMDLQLVDLIDQIDEVFNTSLIYTRTLVADLYPPVLYEFGLPAALEWLGNHMRKQAMTVTLELGDTDGLNLSEDRAVLLFQSVRELLMNVAKHATTNTAHVRLSQADGILHLQVRDEGVGFNLEAVESHDGGTSSHFGLFSIRERMKALGGAFDIQTRPGLGTTAIMTLPLAGEAKTLLMTPLPIESELVKPERSFLTPPNGPKVRVLLVDDHAMVRQGLRSVLETYPDIEVVGEASDGKQAVISAARLQPSIVVMDINMPTMNGIEATKSITTRFPRILVIGLSVNADSENQQAMKAAGATILLTKESAVEQLYGAISRALGTPTACEPEPLPSRSRK